MEFSSTALAVLIVASCGTSDGARTPPDVTLAGIGVTPRQLGEDGVLPTQPPVTSAITQPDLPPLSDPRVFMVGDSVLLATTQGQPDALDTYVGSLGWDITVDARVSRFTDEGVTVLRRRRDEIHEVVVVVLGNNYGGDEAQFAAQIDELLGVLDGVRVIAMLTVPVYADKQNEVNLILRNAAAADNRIVAGRLGGLHPPRPRRAVERRRAPDDVRGGRDRADDRAHARAGTGR